MNDDTAVAVATPVARKPKLIERVAGHLHVEPNLLLSCLKNTCFKQTPGEGGQIIEPTNEEMMALLIVADQYHLNPVTRELYAYRDKRRGGIVPIVGIDGWIRIVESHPQYAGCTFKYYHKADDKLDYIECTMYRKDRAHPMVIPEYFGENKRNTENWTGMPHRMLRHRAYIQAARYAFGFAGIYDPDEGAAIVEGTATVMPADSPIADINAEITGKTVETAASKPQDAAPVFTYAQVRAALEESLEGPDEAFALACEMIEGVADIGQHEELEQIANKIAHQRADRKAAAQE